MPPEPPETTPDAISRRTLLAAATFVPLSALLATAQTAPVLPPAQTKALSAFVDRLIPADELGAGALDAGVMNYIERALTGAYANRRAGLVEGLLALDDYARRKYGFVFSDLSAAQRDAVIGAAETGSADGFANAAPFFATVRSLTMEGMFGDPFYGGNRNYSGWDLIRYPGPRLAVGPPEQAMKVEIKPVRMSARGGDHAR